MTPELNEQLEDVRIRLEVAALQADEVGPYLAEALRLCGEDVEGLDDADLLERAREVADAYLDEVKRGKGGRFQKKGGGRKQAKPKGMRMVFGVLRKVGMGALRGVGHVLKGAGGLLKGAGAAMRNKD